MIEYKTEKEQKSAKKITKIGFIAFPLVFFIAFLINGETESKVNFTVENYWQIEEGMTYGEVSNILNEQGKEISTDHKSPELTETTYRFYSDNGGYAHITFENNKLIHKFQNNLKKRNE